VKNGIIEEFSIIDLIEANVIMKSKDKTNVANFINLYNVKAIKYRLTSKGGLKAVYSTKSLTEGYKKYTKNTNIKPGCIRDRLIKAVLTYLYSGDSWVHTK